MSGLPRYGDDMSTDDIKAGIFSERLAKYSMPQIAEAFSKWLDTGKHLPCIANIIELIEPPVIYDKQVYGNLKKRMRDGGTFISDDDYRYVREYEDHVVKSVRKV